MVVFAIMVAATAFAQEPTKPAAPSAQELQRRAEWLRQNAVTIRSVDPKDGDFSDLAGIGRAIGDATVVLLGERHTAMALSSSPRPD
jgi:hypothetical protein